MKDATRIKLISGSNIGKYNGEEGYITDYTVASMGKQFKFYPDSKIKNKAYTWCYKDGFFIGEELEYEILSEEFPEEWCIQGSDELEKWMKSKNTNNLGHVRYFYYYPVNYNDLEQKWISQETSPNKKLITFKQFSDKYLTKQTETMEKPQLFTIKGKPSLIKAISDDLKELGYTFYPVELENNVITSNHLNSVDEKNLTRYKILAKTNPSPNASKKEFNLPKDYSEVLEFCLAQLNLPYWTEEDYKVGDWVVVLPEDTCYYNSEKGPQKIAEIRGKGATLPYSLEFSNGDTNSYKLIRRATKEEIDNLKPKTKTLVLGTPRQSIVVSKGKARCESTDFPVQKLRELVLTMRSNDEVELSGYKVSFAFVHIGCTCFSKEDIDLIIKEESIISGTEEFPF